MGVVCANRRRKSSALNKIFCSGKFLIPNRRKNPEGFYFSISIKYIDIFNLSEKKGKKRMTNKLVRNFY